jgi:hypothetical protein
MTDSGWPIRSLRVLVAAAIVAGAAWYSPWIEAAGWRVFHPGGRVSYRGLRVLVPWPWTANEEAVKAEAAVSPQGILLRRTPYTLQRRSLNQSIFVTVISADPGVSAARQQDGWLEMFRATHPGASFEGRTLASGGAASSPAASCLSARYPATSDGASPEGAGAQGVVWTCISVENGWVANFEGRDGDADVFFRVVGSLKR